MEFPSRDDQYGGENDPILSEDLPVLGQVYQEEREAADSARDPQRAADHALRAAQAGLRLRRLQRIDRVIAAAAGFSQPEKVQEEVE